VNDRGESRDHALSAQAERSAAEVRTNHDSGLTHGLSKARIEALTDGIFAVAMTLLVLDIKVPEIDDFSQLPRELQTLWPKVLSYAISFVMLGIYWVGHHNQFHLIRGADRALLWINILFLMTISFVPFSTALLSAYPQQQIALTVYGGSLVAIGMILYGHWAYATHGHRLIDIHVDPRIVRSASKRILIGPAMFGGAIFVSIFSPATALAIFVAVPLVYLMPGNVDRHWSNAAGARK
jgi:uncharacterized membrane protein